MNGQQQPVPLGRDADQGQSQQWRLGHLDVAVAVHEVFERGLGVVVLGQVDLDERHLDMPMHHLNRIAGAVAHKRGPQVRVPPDERLRGPAQPVGIDAAAEFHTELHDVGVDGTVGELGMEQQSRL